MLDVIAWVRANAHAITVGLALLGNGAAAFGDLDVVPD